MKLKQMTYKLYYNPRTDDVGVEENNNGLLQFSEEEKVFRVLTKEWVLICSL
jgi:hypothetical protein